MTALILVVDDIASNVRLLEVKLSEKYYQVITASSGVEAIEIAKEKQPDVILLDVMMPVMDGFEACKRLKQDYSTIHIPVIIVTALSDINDKIQGLTCGADDFLIKPINEFALFSRIKSLLRFKVVLDELRLRMNTNSRINKIEGRKILEYVEDNKFSKISVVDDGLYFEQIKKHLGTLFNNIILVSSAEISESDDNSDIFIINLSIDMSLLKACSLLKSRTKTRLTPILAIIDDDNHEFISQLTDLGISDYISLPLNGNELLARVTTQIKRKKYQDSIERSMDNSLKLSIVDQVTSVYNRHYFEKYAYELMASIRETSKTFSLVMYDIDHFKAVNDDHGHLCGDSILKGVASVLKDNLRINDLIVRFGGEEFLIILFDVGINDAVKTANRIRVTVSESKFEITGGDFANVTISGGVSEFHCGETVKETIKRADNCLYKAKAGGRNMVISERSTK